MEQTNVELRFVENENRDEHLQLQQRVEETQQENENLANDIASSQAMYARMQRHLRSTVRRTMSPGPKARANQQVLGNAINDGNPSGTRTSIDDPNQQLPSGKAAGLNPNSPKVSSKSKSASEGVALWITVLRSGLRNIVQPIAQPTPQPETVARGRTQEPIP